jgi:ketosteroid isomerase-like protein
MSQDHIEIVRRFYDAWSNHEFPGPVGHMDPDIEYVNPPGAIEPGTRHGLPEFTRAVEKVLDAWEFWWAEPEELKPVGEHVAVLVRYRARGRGSGAEVEGRESALWTLRDGKVVRYEWFHEPPDAFRAVGVEE